MIVPRLLVLSAAACLALASCDNMKKGGSTSSDPYASNYGNDGHYNPYPSQSGYTNPTPTTPTYQTPAAPTYQTPPAPPSDPYSFGSTKPAPTSYSKPKPAPKKTVASSSSAKKKSSGTKSPAKKSSSGSRYAVGKGDTLYGIALKKHTTVAKIKAANGLSSDIIRPGQSLKIP